MNVNNITAHCHETISYIAADWQVGDLFYKIYSDVLMPSRFLLLIL